MLDTIKLFPSISSYSIYSSDIITQNLFETIENALDGNTIDRKLNDLNRFATYNLKTIRSDNGETAWHVAKEPKVLQYLFKKINNLIDEKNSQGLTPLQLAVLRIQSIKYRELVRLKANINVIDDKGNTILHFAAKTAALDPIKYFYRVDLSNQRNDYNLTFLDVFLESHPRTSLISSCLKKGGTIDDLCIISGLDKFYTYEKDPHQVIPLYVIPDKDFNFEPATYYIYADHNTKDIFVSYLDTNKVKITTNINDNDYIKRCIKSNNEENKEKFLKILDEKKILINDFPNETFRLQKFFNEEEITCLKAILPNDFSFFDNINSLEELTEIIENKSCINSESIQSAHILNESYLILSGESKIKLQRKHIDYLTNFALVQKQEESIYEIDNDHEIFKTIKKSISSPNAIRILKKCDPESLKSLRDEKGNTLLHLTARSKSLDDASIFLLDYIEPTIKNNYGYTPLFYIFMLQSSDRAWLSNLNDLLINFNKIESTILDRFSHKMHIQYTESKPLLIEGKKLLENEFSIITNDQHSGLVEYLGSNFNHFVKSLKVKKNELHHQFDHSYAMIQNLKSKENFTQLANQLDLFFAYNAINLTDKNNDTLMHLAAKHLNINAMCLILAKDPDLTLENKYGKTPLKILFNELAKQNADLSKVTSVFNRLLMEAVCLANDKIIDELLSFALSFDLRPKNTKLVRYLLHFASGHPGNKLLNKDLQDLVSFSKEHHDLYYRILYRYFSETDLFLNLVQGSFRLNLEYDYPFINKIVLHGLFSSLNNDKLDSKEKISIIEYASKNLSKDSLTSSNSLLDFKKNCGYKNMGTNALIRDGENILDLVEKINDKKIFDALIIYFPETLETFLKKEDPLLQAVIEKKILSSEHLLNSSHYKSKPDKILPAAKIIYANRNEYSEDFKELFRELLENLETELKNEIPEMSDAHYPYSETFI